MGDVIKKKKKDLGTDLVDVPTPCRSLFSAK